MTGRQQLLESLVAAQQRIHLVVVVRVVAVVGGGLEDGVEVDRGDPQVAQPVELLDHPHQVTALVAVPGGRSVPLLQIGGLVNPARSREAIGKDLIEDGVGNPGRRPIEGSCHGGDSRGGNTSSIGSRAAPREPCHATTQGTRRSTRVDSEHPGNIRPDRLLSGGLPTLRPRRICGRSGRARGGTARACAGGRLCGGCRSRVESRIPDGCRCGRKGRCGACGRTLSACLL